MQRAIFSHLSAMHPRGFREKKHVCEILVSGPAAVNQLVVATLLLFVFSHVVLQSRKLFTVLKYHLHKFAEVPFDVPDFLQ